MNLIITNVCNRACPYCFARNKVELKGESAAVKRLHMPLENFKYCLDFLDKSQCKAARLLGGEPSIHPDFCEMITQCLARHFKIVIFTNGLWPPAVQELFKKVTSPDISFIFNINEPTVQRDKESEWQAKSLKIAGQRGECGFNLYHDDFDMMFLADVMDKAGMHRRIRIGLASPIVGTTNDHPAPAQFEQMGMRLARQMRQLEQRDVLVGFDCGFPLCMFRDEDVGTLVKCSTGWHSNCGSAIDVGPDLTVWPCFPLSNVLNVKLAEFSTLREMTEFFRKRLSPFRSFGIKDECETCKYHRREQCCGGCLAHVIRSWGTTGDPRLLEKLNSVASKGGG